ncbi:hypothetical protein FPSE_02621 [Fusarium pseudograminearum CS3096]|uniref:Uncharacterized protein n=1 Tax=Fusarium pseudograminearum (strain CS3096) TaxID=1028729 RepID=K3UWW5_FUSPC|nr:hypothetical protein FPSE_02621 [Fusarium pseudograminearum CS3096]EKJ77171.1 hypothetical protein FPSE_02621 [Fusarium pseudograminearum CS3096]
MPATVRRLLEEERDEGTIWVQTCEIRQL